jgi:hypothetical protein
MIAMASLFASNNERWALATCRPWAEISHRWQSFQPARIRDSEGEATGIAFATCPKIMYWESYSVRVHLQCGALFVNIAPWQACIGYCILGDNVIVVVRLVCVLAALYYVCQPRTALGHMRFLMPGGLGVS